jgi:hypothetical protein
MKSYEKNNNIEAIASLLFIFYFFILLDSLHLLSVWNRWLKDHIKDTFRQSDNRHYTKTMTDDVIFSLGFFDGLK